METDASSSMNKVKLARTKAIIMCLSWLAQAMKDFWTWSHQSKILMSKLPLKATLKDLMYSTRTAMRRSNLKSKLNNANLSVAILSQKKVRKQN